MIYSPHTFEISLSPNTKEFNSLLSEAYEKGKKKHRVFKDKKSGTIHIDEALSEDGITIEYHNDIYKKQIKLIVNPSRVLAGDDLELWKPNKDNISKLLKNLETHIDDYFDSEYELCDFALTRIDFTVNIQVGSKEQVSAYIEILHRIGKVKGFSQKYDTRDNGWYDKELSFDLEGNSNGVEFTAYDKQGALAEKNKDEQRTKAAKGILRIEVRLTKKKAIKKYTKKSNTAAQIKDLSKRSKDIFLETFVKVVPHGCFLKKKPAQELIEKSIPNKKQREKMLQLLEFVPKKKSLLLAQKEMNSRNIDKIMDMFAKIELSPITISKRSNVKQLKNLYDYLLK